MKRLYLILFFVSMSWADVPNVIPEKVKLKELPALLNRNFQELDRLLLNVKDKTFDLAVSTGIIATATIDKTIWAREVRAEQRYSDAGQRDDDIQGQVNDAFLLKLSRGARGESKVYRTMVLPLWISNTDIYFENSAGNLTTSLLGNGAFVRSGSTIIGNLKKTFVNLGIDSTISIAESEGYSTIAGGVDNTIIRGECFIGAGESNTINARRGIIGGGKDNTVGSSAGYGFIGGGLLNVITGASDVISGGNENVITNGGHSFIGGGKKNKLAGSYTGICSGYENTVSSSNYSFLGGGESNLIQGSWGSDDNYNVICGGSGSLLSDSKQAFMGAGGGLQLLNSNYSFMGAGGSNKIQNSDYSVIVGGHVNWIVGAHYASAGGKYMRLSSAADRTFLWGYSDSAVTVTTPDIFGIYSGNTEPTIRLICGATEHFVDISYSSVTDSVSISKDIVGVISTATWAKDSDKLDGQHGSYYGVKADIGVSTAANKAANVATAFSTGTIAYKVKISSNDTTGYYLNTKIRQGVGISISTEGAGGNEYLKIAADAGSGPFNFYFKAKYVDAYREMTSTITKVTASTITLTSLSNGNHLISSFTTLSGYPGLHFLNGTLEIHTHFTKTGTKDVVAYALIYKRDIGDSETLIGTTDMSNAVETILTMAHLRAALSNVNTETTDRITVKIYINVSGVGAPPTVSQYIEGDHDCYMSLPIPAIVEHSHLFSLGWTDSEHTGTENTFAAFGADGEAVEIATTSWVAADSELLDGRNYDTFVDTYTTQVIGGQKTFDNEVTISSNMYVLGKVGIGTDSPNSPLEVVGAKPGVVGGFHSGMLQVRGDAPAEEEDEFYNSVITGHNSFNTNTQLWYLGSTSSLNNDIAFINRQAGDLAFSTTNQKRMVIKNNGYVSVGSTYPYTKFQVCNGSITVSGDDAHLILGGNAYIAGYSSATEYYGDGTAVTNVDAETLDGYDSTDFLLASYIVLNGIAVKSGEIATHKGNVAYKTN